MNIPPIGSFWLSWPSESQLSFNLDDMMQKAKEYSSGDVEVFGYIESVLNDKEFQSDPQKYLAEWNETRGSSHISIHPEDDAHVFFITHFQYKPAGWCSII